MNDDQAAKDVRATFAAFGPDVKAKIAERLQSDQSSKDTELTRLRERNAELESSFEAHDKLLHQCLDERDGYKARIAVLESAARGVIPAVVTDGQYPEPPAPSLNTVVDYECGWNAALEEAAKIVAANEGPHRYVDDMVDAICALKRG